MKCPSCNFIDTKVCDSRMSQNGSSIRRRRECLQCEFRFSTVENVVILDLTVIKRDGTHEPYMTEKLRKGVQRSLQKRPYTREQFENMVQNIETDIQKLRKNEITSEQVGDIVMKRLKPFDKVAYIRFASVYRQFEDVSGFQNEIAGLTKRPSIQRKKKKKSVRVGSKNRNR